MKKLIYLTFICNFFFLNSYSQSITRLLACSPYDDNMVVLDTNNYNLIDSKTLTFSTGSVDGITGLAKKPSTGVYYAVIKSSSSRYLGTLDPTTGAITNIGDLLDNFSQITFNGNNTLLGVTGTGASNPSAVYRINAVTAAKSFVNYVNSNYGEVICYNPTNNKVYQWTGGNPYAYRRYDTTFTSSSAVTPVNSTYEVTGAVYKTAGKFVTFDLDQNFLQTDTVGNNNQVAYDPNDVYKGLAYITCSRTITASSASVCVNSAVTFTMSGVAGATYQWYKNNTLVPGANSATFSTIGSGYIKCSIHDGCGMDTLAPGKNIGVLTTPVVTISGNTLVCSGQTLQLTGSSGGSSQWYQNGVLVPGATTNSLIVTAAGVYNMVKTNLNGCKDSAAISKVVIIAPSPTIVVTSTSPSLCVGQSATLIASGANTYTWVTFSSTSSLVVSPTSNTTYTATGTATSGCSSFTNLALNVSPLPSVNITASQNTICLGQETSLTADGASTYSWSTGSSSTGIVVSPNSDITYTVTGTDANNCSRTASLLVTVTDCTGLNVISLKPMDVKLYPNPTEGDLVIQSSEEINTIEVIDLIGKTVLKKNADGTATSHLNLSTLDNSVYIVRINYVSGNVTLSKVTLNR